MSQIMFSNIRAGNLHAVTSALGVIQIRWTPVFTGVPFGFAFNFDFTNTGYQSWTYAISTSKVLAADGVDVRVMSTLSIADVVSTGVDFFYIALGPSLDSPGDPLT